MIREARYADIPAIRRLMEAEPGFWQEGWSNETLTRGIDSSGGLAFVWENDNGILGFVCAHDLGFRAYLSELLVAQQMRGRGVGKILLDRVQTSLAQRGCTILIADVWHAAVPFYRALDWEPPDAVLLRRKLDIKSG